MKIILAISTRNNNILRIDKALCSLGFEVAVLSMDDYTNQSSYLGKKLDDWGYSRNRKAFENRRRLKLRKMLADGFKNILWINSPAGVLNPDEFAEVSKIARHFIWFVDGVADNADIRPYLNYAAKIGCFEYNDVACIQKYTKTEAVYCPIGYSDVYEHVRAAGRDIDISFVGSPFKNRLRLLEELAKAAGQNNWQCEFCGPFWEPLYFWKKWIFKLKYPNVYRYVRNGTMAPAEVAELYARSKICLNIHAEQHKSPNPRFFEIIKAGALQLCDARENYVGDIKPPQAMDIFHDFDSLLEKVKFYLENNEKREKVAEYGQSRNMYNMQYSLSILLNN